MHMPDEGDQDAMTPPAEPESTGAQGAQSASQPTDLTVVPAADWKAQESLSDSLRGMQESRRVAASAVFGIASAGVKMLEDELTSARRDRQAADSRERQTLERYYLAKETAAVSKAHSEHAAASSRLRSIMQNLAAVLIGAAITLWVVPCPMNDPTNSGGLKPGYVAAAFALLGVLLFVTSFASRASHKNSQESSNVV